VVPEQLSEGEGEFVIGVTLYKYGVSVPMWMKHRNPVDQIKGDVSSVTRVLSALFAPKQKGETKRVGKALSGPIMIVTSLWMTVMSGLLGTLAFVRFLNMNLAMLNLLPIPVLDGGHIVFALLRGIFRREVPAKVVNALVNVFAVLLIFMFIIVSLRDVWSMSVIFGGSRGGDTQELAAELEPASTNAPALSE
jgi:regulator of sigma E protease